MTTTMPNLVSRIQAMRPRASAETDDPERDPRDNPNDRPADDPADDDAPVWHPMPGSSNSKYRVADPNDPISGMHIVTRAKPSAFAKNLNDGKAAENVERGNKAMPPEARDGALDDKQKDKNGK